MFRRFASLSVVTSLLLLSACCGTSGSCNGSHHIFLVPVPVQGVP